MLNFDIKRKINTLRDILVGKVPDPKAQVEQITIALIYKFMDDMDKAEVELGGKPTFFAGKNAKYAWKEIRQQANPYENKLLIDDELQEILEKRCILESDIQKTIDYAEATGKRIKEIASGCWIASYRIGYVTFWVWYLLEGEAYRLVHAYSHRMEIEVKNNVN